MDPWLERSWHLYKGPSYVRGCGLVGPCLIGMQQVDIRRIPGQRRAGTFIRVHLMYVGVAWSVPCLLACNKLT